MMMRTVDNLIATIRRRAFDQSGIGIMESLVAVLVLGIGLLGTIAAITSARGTTESARRADTAVHVAQQQLERMQATPYGSLKMTAQPSGPLYTDAPDSNPNSRVLRWGTSNYYLFNYVKQTNASTWEWLADDLTQPILAPYDTATAHATAQIKPTDTTATDSSIPEGYTVYRYVTYRNENCGSSSCNSTKYNSKRLVVGVTADAAGNDSARQKPIMVSTIVLDPS